MKIKNLNDRRFASYHNKCKGQCSSKKSYNKNFDPDKSHIYLMAVAKLAPVRFSLTKAEVLSSIIQGGKLNYDKCRNNPLEIAVEGKIVDFPWVNPQARDGEEIEGILDEVYVRLIIRQMKNNNFIVTVYPLDQDEIKTSEYTGEIPIIEIIEW